MAHLNKSTYRVYYEDTDAAGVVYHANYLKFMERGRTDWLRVFKIKQSKLKIEYQIVFVVAKSEIFFRKPAKFDDEVVVTTKLVRLRGASVCFEQEITVSDVFVCNAINTVACVDMTTYLPKRIPRTVRRVFEGG
jgi:acyl-CoA thioester hydrolase